jgi:hypothetical protein
MGRDRFNRSLIDEVTRTVDGDYKYKDVLIKRLSANMLGVEFPDGHKKKYPSVRAAVNAIKFYSRKEVGNASGKYDANHIR